MSVRTPPSLEVTAEPESVGLSSERLRRIDRHLSSRYIDPGKIAGSLTLVHRGGELVYLSPLGHRDLERELPMTADTLFRIFSMTKPITSVALMTLYEQGAFELNDPIAKFIPELGGQRVYRGGLHPAFVTVPAVQPITIRHLLTHTSGLTYGFLERTPVDRAYRELEVNAPRHGGTVRDMIDRLVGLPLEFEPGTAWNYSVATDLLGHLVQVLSRRPFDRYLDETLFEPLGMIDTTFAVRDDQLDRFAASYHRGPDKRLVLLDDPRNSEFAGDVTFHSGGGGLLSTASDYLAFCRMLLGGGELDGRRILGPRTIETMTRNHLPGGADLTDLSIGAFSEVAYEGTGFGLGFSVTVDPLRAGVLGRGNDYGWGGISSTIFWIDPAEDLIVIFLTQFYPSGTFNFRGQLKSIVYSSIID